MIKKRRLRKYAKRLLALTVALLTLCLSACAEWGLPDISAKIEYSEEKKWDMSVRDVYYADVSDYEYLRPYVERLLANEQQAVVDYEEKSIAGWEAPDPDAPYILPSISYALYDITLDGIPELVTDGMGYGGSSGGTTFFVYDIITGEEIGVIGCGARGSWSTYFDFYNETLLHLSSYWLRCGWAESSRYLSGIERSESDGLYRTKDYFEYIITYDEVVFPDGVRGLDMIESKYYAYGEEMEAEKFFLKREDFEANAKRLPQTEMISLYYSDVCPDEENLQRKAKNMAKALFSTEQKIALPIKEEQR